MSTKARWRRSAAAKRSPKPPGFQFKGFIAWLMWLFLHVFFLIGFRNRFAVMFEWFWAYLTRERSARLITGDAEEMQDVTACSRTPRTPDISSHSWKPGSAKRRSGYVTCPIASSQQLSTMR